MRHQHMCGEAAIDRDAELARRVTEDFIPAHASRTDAATDPRIDRNSPSKFNAISIGADAIDDTGDLVAERERQLATGRDIKVLALAHVEVAVLQMDIGVTHAAMR